MDGCERRDYTGGSSNRSGVPPYSSFLAARNVIIKTATRKKIEEETT